MRLEHHLKHISRKFECQEERIVNLESALKLALDMLFPLEPGDSRAVSNEYVAMGAVLCALEDKKTMDLIRERNHYYTELAIAEQKKREGQGDERVGSDSPT